MAVEIRWKEPAEVTVIEIDPDAITWGHLIQFQDLESKVNSGDITEREMLAGMADILGAATGLDIRKTSARVVSELLISLKKLSIVDGENAKNSESS